MKDLDILNTLKELTGAKGVSGDERSASETALRLLGQYAPDAFADSFGNVTALIKCGKPDAGTLMLDAHIDQIGLIVTCIDKDGFLKVGCCGGADMKIMLAQSVTVHGDVDIPGVISTLPPHVSSDHSKVPEAGEISVDIGMTKEQAEICIGTGSPVYFHMPARMLSEDCLSGPALDDRACFTCILYALELLKRQGKKPDCDLIVVGASCEEMRGKGVTGLGYDLQPDLAAAIDVCHAATYDVDPLDGVHPVGSGPAIAV